MEVFARPAVGAIIEKVIDGVDCILIQERCKENDGNSHGTD
jgi:ADP-ribose pyrophosphatase